MTLWLRLVPAPASFARRVVGLTNTEFDLIFAYPIDVPVRLVIDKSRVPDLLVVGFFEGTFHTCEAVSRFDINVDRDDFELGRRRRNPNFLSIIIRDPITVGIDSGFVDDAYSWQLGGKEPH